MRAVRKALTARYSEMNPRSKAASSFDRRTRLLTVSGLIAGTIPLSMRRALNQQTLDFASLPPDGDTVEELEKTCTF